MQLVNFEKKNGRELSSAFGASKDTEVCCSGGFATFICKPILSGFILKNHVI